jgi:phenylacetate-coenzyme A ligase PaaK-like adenylate-forming protein
MTGTQTLHALSGLWRHPKASREDLVSFQNRRLRRLISHAYANVPYYRRLFDDAGIRPGDVKEVGDLRNVPITGKEDLRAAPSTDVFSAGVDPGRLRERKTSGSSGQPFTIRRTGPETSLLSLFRLRARRQVGVRFADRIAAVVEPRPDLGKPGLKDRLAQRLPVFSQDLISCFEPAEEILLELERLGPDVISGYSSVLAHLAPRVGVDGSPRLRPRLLLSGGDSLTPVMRERIQRGFGAPLFDLYGAEEFNIVAWDCPRSPGTYHVGDDNVIVEVLRAGAPVEEGEEGEVIATGLHSYAMPFIRYRLGDLVVRGGDGCECGQPFSTVREIRGRALDYLRLPGGRQLHPYAIAGPLIDQEQPAWVARHQVVQEAEDRILILIEPLRPPLVEQLDRLRHLAREALGADVECRFELVAEIPPEPSGKFSAYRSLLTPEP